jgi:hypothetical protein
MQKNSNRKTGRGLANEELEKKTYNIVYEHLFRHSRAIFDPHTPRANAIHGRTIRPNLDIILNAL